MKPRTPGLFTPPPSCILSKDGGGKDGLGAYRYELRIPLGSGHRGVLLFILANPSTAVVVNGVFESDPTVTRCIAYARAWGYRTLVVANVRAWRETNAKLVPPDPLGIGPDNDEHLIRLVQEAERIVCGWGKLGGLRGAEVVELVLSAGKSPYCLVQNGDGSPSHPLYLPAELQPVLMRVPCSATIREHQDKKECDV